MNIKYQTLILKKKEIAEKLKFVKYKDLEDIVYRMQLANEEVKDILD